MKKPTLVVEGLSIEFSQYEKGLKKKNIEVISSLDLEINSGEVVAVVGASGSGKSLLAHAILGILPKNSRMSGSIYYEGRTLNDELLKSKRGGEICLIPQSVNFLDPLMKVGKQVKGINGTDKQVLEVFERYGLSKEAYDLYPHELSGGMARRILVATAVLTGAKLIIADEPTPGLSEELAAEALGHLRQLADNGCAVMLITHDLGIALKITDRLAIFYAGKTIENANAADFEKNGGQLRHPYMKALWKSLPQNDFETISGSQPYAETRDEGCAFRHNCPIATEDCIKQVGLCELRGGKVRCINAT